MSHIRLDIAYNGLEYLGFQSQPHGNTIQDLLELCLHQHFGMEVRITSASRTDAGVSAEHQVVTFPFSASLDLSTFVGSFNHLLPPAIRVKKAYFAEAGFHPSFSSIGKIYRYRIWKGQCHNPFVRDFVWENFRGAELARLEEMMSVFIGRHDFRAFAHIGTDQKSTVRKIYDVKVEELSTHFNIWISGSGFLKQMVRIMVGTSVDQALGRLAKPISEVILELDRSQAGRTAPANGLCLVKIIYDEIPNLLDFIQQYNEQATLTVNC